jgi:hypothetical protein
MSLVSEGSYGKALASARAGTRLSSFDALRLTEWRRLRDAGAEPVAAFVTVATHPDYGYKSYRGSPSMPPAKALDMFRRFCERCALPEWERARAEAALSLAETVKDAAATVSEFVKVRVFETPMHADAARVALASSKVALEAAGIVGGAKSGTTVNVSALAQASADGSHDLAARIAADPVASRKLREMLDALDAAQATQKDAEVK